MSKFNPWCTRHGIKIYRNIRDIRIPFTVINNRRIVPGRWSRPSCRCPITKEKPYNKSISCYYLVPPRKQPIYTHTKFKSLQYLNVMQHRISIQVTGGVKIHNRWTLYILYAYSLTSTLTHCSCPSCRCPKTIEATQQIDKLLWSHASEKAADIAVLSSSRSNISTWCNIGI